MELLKKNIHMERVRSEATTQITLEEDVNIPDSKPDVNQISLQNGSVLIEEVRPGNDVVNVRGKLNCKLLYHTLESGSRLVMLESSIPFDEKINMNDLNATDMVNVAGKIEDLTVGIINSRKLAVQSLITMEACVNEVFDVEAPIGIRGDEPVEYRRQSFPVAQIAIDKKDVFRIKEEVSLPSNYPNIYQLLWNHISLSDVEFKAQDGRIALQGDVLIFLLYEGEGEDRPVRSYETTIPFSGVLDCSGCREGMIPDIRYSLGQQELTVRPDFDGEERNVGVDLAMDIDIRAYEEDDTDVITDIYGVHSDIQTVSSPAMVQQLLSKVTGKTKVTDRIRVEESDAPILQILHSEGEVQPTSQQVVENGIQLEGDLAVRVMYITGDDENPYASVEAHIPYQYTLEIPGIRSEDMGNVQSALEQLQVTMLDSEEMDVKAILTFDTTVLRNIPMNLISDVNVTDLDNAAIRNLPGIVVYTVKAGDSLWSIGRKYYVSVDSLKRWNNLTSDELMIGQKLLIVKGQ